MPYFHILYEVYRSWSLEVNKIIWRFPNHFPKVTDAVNSKKDWLTLQWIYQVSNAIIDEKKLYRVNHTASISQRVSAFSSIAYLLKICQFHYQTIHVTCWIRGCHKKSNLNIRKTIDSTYPINSFKEEGFSQNIRVSFLLLNIY